MIWVAVSWPMPLVSHTLEFQALVTPRCSCWELGHKRTETGQQLDLWGVELHTLAPKPRFPRALQGQKLHTSPLTPNHITLNTAQLPQGTPSPAHPSGSHLAGLDLSDRIFGTGSMFYCHKRWLESRFPLPPHPITYSSINWSILWQISYFFEYVYMLEKL